MPVIEGYRFAVDLEDRGLSRGLKEIKNEAQALKNVMRANFTELKNGESTFSAYSQRIKDAQKSIDTYQVAIDKLKRQIDSWNAQQAKNIDENDKLNRQIVRAKNTIARYTVAQSNLKRQMEQDTLAMKRAETGIDALRKATQGITTSNKALVESFKQSGHYYAANRASAVGLKNESKALEAQLKAESEVTKQLKNAQSGLITESDRIKSKIPTITAEIQKNKLAYEQLGKKVGDLSLEFGAQSKRAELVRKKQAEIKEKIDKSTKSYDRAKNRLRGLSDELGKNSAKLANQAEKTQKASAQLQKLEKESRSLRNTKLGSFYSATSAKLTKFNTTLKQSTSNTRHWWQESKTGFATVGITLGGLTAGAAKAVSDAAKVQKQYIEVKNLIRTGGESVSASIKESNEMQREGTKLSMQYGFAQKQIGIQYEELVKRGYSGTAALGSMNSMMKAARASGDDLADVVKVTAQTVDAFGLRVDNNTKKMQANSNRVANAIASSSDRTASSFKDTGTAMSYVASSAKTVGWDVEQTAGALGELSNRGIEGSQAGTGLRKVITSLIEPTKNAQGALQKAGLSMDDFKTKSGKLKDVDQIFKLINQHTHGWGKARQAAFFKDLFGTTGVAAGEALAQSAGGIKKNDEALSSLISNIRKDEKSDYVGRLARKNMKSAQMQIERVKRTAQAFELSVGSALLPSVNKVGSALAKWAVSKEGTRSMKEFSSAAGSLATHIANHTKDIIAFTKGILSGVKDTYHFIKPIATTVGKVAGFFNKSSKGSQSTARNLGKIVGIFGTAAVGLKVVKTLFGGIFAVSKDTTKSVYSFVNWIKGGSKAQRGLNAQIQETNRLIEKSIALQRQYNSQVKKDDFSSKSNSSGDIADDVSDAMDVADELKGGKKEEKAIGDLAKDTEKAGAKSAHFWQRGWLGKLGGFNKRLFAKLNPKSWTSTFAKLGDKAGNGFHLHLLKKIKGLGGKIKNVFSIKSWTRTFANLGDKAGEKFVKATSTKFVNSRGKVKFSALFKYGSKAAEEAGGKAGMGWMRRLVMHIGNGRNKFHAGIKGLFGVATDTAEASGVSGAAGFLGKFATKLKAGAGYLGAVWEVASIGIDIVKGIRSHNPDQKMRSYGSAAGGLLGGAIGAAVGGPGGAVIGAGIGQAIGHSLPDIIKWGKKAASAFGKGWHNSMKWLGQLMTGDMKGVTKGWNNFWGGMGDWFDQTFGVDTGKHHKAKKPKKKPTVTQRIIKTGVHVSKKDVANVKSMSKALRTYAGSLAKVKSELRKNDPSTELNKVNTFLKSHTKQWTSAAGPIKKIGDAFKYLSKFAGSVAKKDAFAAFNRDLPKLDTTLNKHGNSIKKGIEKITNALKAGGGKKGKGNTLLGEFKDLTKGIKDLTSKVKSLNSNLGKTASDFKAIGKVTKEFKSEKNNPLTRMAKGFDKLTKALKDDTKKITDNVKKINAAFQGKKGKKNFAQIVKDAVKPLNSMAGDFKSMAKNMPKVASSIKSMTKNIKALTKGGKSSPVIKLGNNFDTLKKKINSDASTITSKIKSISNSLGGKKGFNARIKYSASKTKDFGTQLKHLASSAKTFASGLKSAISSLKTFASKKKGINSVKDSIKSLYKTIDRYPFGKKISSQAKTAANGLTGKGNFASKLASAAKSVKSSCSSMTDNFAKFVKGFKGSANSLVSGRSSVTSIFKSLKSSVKDTFRSMWHDVKNDTQDGLNDIVSEINDAVDEINDAISSIANNDGKHKVHHTKSVHLAEGTDSISRPTLAVLNDGSDSPSTDNREGLLHSNGILEYLSGRNIMRLLLPGDSVIKASDMAKLPHYANGTSYARKLFNFGEQVKASKRLLKVVQLQTKAQEKRDKERLQEKKLEARTRLQEEKAANRARNQQIKGQQRILKLQQELISGHKASRASTTAYRRKKTASQNKSLLWRKQNAEENRKISSKNYKANSDSYKLQVSESKKKTKKSDPFWVSGDKFNKASGLPKSLRKLVDQGFAQARKASAREKAREAKMPKIYRKNAKGDKYQISRKHLDFSGKTVYLDSGYFSKSGKLTGKIVAVSKSWLKEYDKKQAKILRELGKKRKKSTRRRRSSSTRRRSSSGRTWHWRTSKNGTRYRDYYTPVKHKSTRRKSSSALSSASSRVRSVASSAVSSARSKVSASVTGSKSVKNLADLIKKLKGTHKVTVKVKYGTVSKAKSALGKLASAIKSFNKKKLKNLSLSYKNTYKAKKSISNLVDEIKDYNKTKVNKLKLNYSGTYKAKKSIDRLVKSMKKLNKTKLKKLKVKYSGVSGARKAVKKLTASLKTLSENLSSVTKKAKKDKFGKAISKQAEEAVKTLKSNKGDFAKQFSKMVKDFKKDLSSLEKTSKKDFKSMFTNMEHEQKTHVRSMESNLTHFKNSFTKGMSSLEHGVKSSFGRFWKTMANDAARGMHNVITVLNTAIGRIDTVVKRFGGNSSAVRKVSASFHHYATGTGVFNNQRRAITKPTLAVLNDGSDSPETNNEETIWDTRNNTFGVVKGRNVPAYLEPGMEVLNASESKALGFTRFATGTGALKQLYELAKKYWKNPAKTGSSMFGAVKGLTGAIADIAQGMRKTGENQGTQWWSQLWKMVEDKVNDGSLGPASGLLKAVEELGKNKHYSQGKRMTKFFADCSSLVSRALASAYHVKWATPNGWALTVAGLWQHAHRIPRSEAKPGDPVFWLPGEHVGVYAGHGKYYSAYGPNDGGPVGMQSVASGATFGRFNGLNTEGTKDSKNIKVKANNDLQKFIKPQVGKGFWQTVQKIADKYGDNGLAGAFKLGGDVAQRVKALAKGLKSADPRATRNGLAAIVGNAITESTLNPSVVNGIGAAGLWQFYQDRRTGLNNYAARHNVSWKNPATQINYALNADKSRALFRSILEGHGSVASLAYKFSRLWEVGGHDDAHVQGALEAAKILGYANGGIANRASIFGEDGPEMAIPLTDTKNARAWELVGKTVAILSKKSGLKDQINSRDEKEEEDWRKEVLLILRLLLSRDKDIDVKFDIDGRKVFEGIKRYINENNRRATAYQRRGLSGHY